MHADYPDDDDGEVLRQVAAAGADMSKPMRIDFTIDVPDGERARSLAERIAALGYEPSVFVDDESGAISLYCARVMLATHEGVVAAQAELNSLCIPFGAECDGWLTAGNKQEH
jgi:hypothetical protein